MKKFFSSLVLFVAFLAVSAGAQSLADIAAQTRAKQKANTNAQVIDNDILPSVTDPSAYGSPYEVKKDDASDKTDKKDGAKADEKAEKKNADAKDEAGKKDDQKTAAADDKQEATDGLKKRIESQEKEIAQLQRELDVDQREARLRAAAYYADAGTMLRDQGKFAEDSRKSQADIDAKTKALADAKQKLEDLQEEARKSGIPSREVESSQ